MTTTTIPTADDVIAKLLAERATRLDELDIPPCTLRERAAYIEETSRLDQRIATVRHAHTEHTHACWALSSIDTEIATAEAWRSLLVDKIRPQLCTELLALPAYARERRAMETQQILEISIDSLDHGLHALPGAHAFSLRSTRLGELLIESGITPDPNDESLRVFGGLRWRGSIREVDRDLDVLKKKRDVAARAVIAARDYLDGVLRAESA